MTVRIVIKEAVLICILTLLMCLSYGQNNVSLFGFKSSIGFANLDNEISTFRFKKVINYEFGLSITKNNYHSYGHTFDLVYSTKGSNRVEGIFDIRLHYILLDFKLNKVIKKTNTIIGGGPYLSVILKKKVTSMEQSLNKYVNDSFKMLDCGMKASISQVFFNKGRYSLSMELGGAYGLINIYKNDIYPIGGWGNKWTRNFNINIGVILQYLDKHYNKFNEK